MNTEQPVQRDCTTPDAWRWPRCSCECVNGPANMVSIPREADDAMLRPFYGCPPEELPLAWQAMLAVVAAKKRRAHGMKGTGGNDGN